MQLKINGKSEEFPGGSVLDLLKTKKIEPQMVAVEVNDSMIERGSKGRSKSKPCLMAKCLVIAAEPPTHSEL